MSYNNSFQQFCGGKFWDTELTWEGDSPQFTKCFQITVLIWAPCAFLWLMSIPYSHYLVTKKSPYLAWSKLISLKILFGGLLTLISLCDLIKGAVDYSNSEKAAAYIVSPIIQAATMVLATVLVHAERTRGIASSGVLFLFYLFMLVAGIIPFYMKILDPAGQGFQYDVYRSVSFYIYYFLLLVQFILHCFGQKIPQPIHFPERPLCPEPNASFLSKLTFNWITSFVVKGYRTTLEEKDVWAPTPQNMTKASAPLFEKAWRKELDRCLRKVDMKIAKQKSNIEIKAEKTPLISEDVDPDEHAKSIKSASLLKILTQVYGLQLLKAQVLKILFDVISFAGPLLQSLLIDYTEDPYIQTWKGYLYATLFVISPSINSIIFNQTFYISQTISMRIKSALIAIVYKKALTMSNDSRKAYTLGEIVTLMSVDCQRVADIAIRLWILWSTPFQIVLAIYFLWGILGPSVLSGLAVILLLIPVNAVLARFQRKLQIALMNQKDKRIKIMNEVLNGIKVLKLYAWELSFKENVDRIRNKELNKLLKVAYLGAITSTIMLTSPFVVSLCCFATFTLTGGILNATNTFVSLTLFNMIRFPVNMLPQMINDIVIASVSLKRIRNFLLQPDMNQYVHKHKSKTETALEITNGTFSWGMNETAVLEDININIKQGQLVAIVGQVGCGKSSFISALLGETEKTKGSVYVNGSVAYVSQQAFIQNKTLRDNIIFENDADEAWYDEVIEACALKPDFEMLPGGGMTEIGEKGINLSGGQKQRVSLARAVYDNADIYLLDDPLSAVDTHVGKHIFEKVMGDKGLLRNKTRVLVTHGIHWLPRVDNIIVLVNGRVTEVGTYEELLSHDGAFAQFLKTYLYNDPSSSDDDPEKKLQLLEKLSSIVSDDHLSEASSERSVNRRTRRKKGTLSNCQKSVKTVSHSRPDVTQNMAMKKKLTTEEKQEVGKVKWSVLLHYGKALGKVYMVFWIFWFMLYHVTVILSSLWLEVWSEDKLLANSSLATTSNYAKRTDLYLGIYGGLGFAQAGIMLTYILLTSYSSNNSSRKMHSGMLLNILRSPMSFFDTTPMGRILNRFSKDIDVVDRDIPNLIRAWMQQFYTVLSTFIIISYSTPIFVSVVIPLGIVFYFIQKFYIPTSRQLKRIESTTRSPIFAHFSETITGASTIRAYGVKQRFIQTSDDLVDYNLSYYYAGFSVNRWLAVNLNFLGSLIVFAAALFAVIGKDTLSGGMVGLSLSYALQVTRSLIFSIQATNDLELSIVSLERVKEYTEIPNEADWYIEECKLPRKWPEEGKISLDDYSLRYRPQLELVLKNLSFDITGGEKVGIVGRTGAGKSSLTLALFRIVEAARGSIIIDGVHIGTVGLHQLRSKLTMLPQDPVMFSGTLRMNLDPLGKDSDDTLWKALEQAHMKEFISSLSQGLAFECLEGGQNLSVGQRQLICLARTLLSKTKILIFDEATAAVDLETDDLIQNTIRKEFADCTVLTIAHRLNTIMDNDRIMVLDAGSIVEFDAPSVLLKDPKSKFYTMAKDANLVSD